MRLPGGVWEDGERRTEASLRRVTGEVELALARCAAIEDPTERVTATLHAALATVGDEPATRERVMALCVDDRRWLMLQLGGAYGAGALWLTDRCSECEGAFEIPLDPATVPVKPAGEGLHSHRRGRVGVLCGSGFRPAPTSTRSRGWTTRRHSRPSSAAAVRTRRLRRSPRSRPTTCAGSAARSKPCRRK